MAAVHFTTIPFEPNMANYTYSHISREGVVEAKFVPVIAGMVFMR